MNDLLNSKFKTIKESLEFIESNGLSKVYTIAKIDKTEDESNYDLTTYVNRCNNDIDHFLELVKEEIPLYSCYIYEKNIKSKLPKLLSSVGYLIACKKTDLADAIYVKRPILYDKIDVILNKKLKNNLLVIGEPGTGKTTLIENYAKFRKLNNIFVLECAKLIGDCSLRGAFEQKVVDVINYAKKNNLILFFDEIHSLIDLGNSIGGMSITDILKPYLTDNKLIFIGATTKKEAHLLLQDEAFKRRFSIIQIEEPTTSELLNIKENFFQNNIEYSSFKLDDKTAMEVIDILHEELPRLFFPDKFIDFIDYYASYRSMSKSSIAINDILKGYIHDYR